MYTLATVPLIRSLPDSVTQVWYADDATALGTVSHLRAWWNAISEKGKKYGYFANAMKTWLVTRNHSVARAAIQAFEGTNINITSDGRPHLGVPLGTQEYTDEFLTKKIEQWSTELRSLSSIAESQPHAAYAALTHGLSSKWSYLSRTIPGISHHLENLESIFRLELIHRFTGRPPPCDDERILFALPARLGGLGLRNPAESAHNEFQSSRMVTDPLKKLILTKNSDYSFKCLSAQLEAKLKIKKQREQKAQNVAKELKTRLSVIQEGYGICKRTRSIQLAHLITNT